MKSKKIKIISAFAVLILVSCLYFGVKTYIGNMEDQAAVEETEESYVFKTEKDNIQSVKFSFGENSFTFEKDDESWIKQEEKDFPLNQDILSETLYSLSSIVADRVLENITNLDEYGLNNPENVISIETDEKTIIQIGIENTSSEQYYVNLKKEPETVYLVASSTVEGLKKNLYDYAEIEEFPLVDTTTVTNISVEKEDSYEMTEMEETETWMISDGKNVEKIDTAEYNTLASAISSLTFESMADYNCSDEEKYGFDDPYAIITVDYTEEIPVESDDTETDVEENSDEKNSEKVSSEEETEETIIEDRQLILYVGDETEENDEICRYVKINDSKKVYRILNDSLTEIVDKKASDFWSLIVNYLSVNKLENLEINDDGEKHTVNVSRETSINEDEEEKVTLSYLLDGEELEDATLFTTFYNKLINLTAQKRLTEEYDPETDEKFSVKFVDTDGNETFVSYYEYDINFYALVVDEKVYIVNKMDVKELFEAYKNLIGEATE